MPDQNYLSSRSALRSQFKRSKCLPSRLIIGKPWDEVSHWKLKCYTKPVSSPKCGRVGNKHCVAAGHYVDCDIHPGSFHSVYADCVKCAHAKQREEQEERAAALKAKEEDEDDVKNQKKKKGKTPKAKPDSQKSMKQLRKEKKEKRRSEGSQDSSPW